MFARTLGGVVILTLTATSALSQSPAFPGGSSQPAGRTATAATASARRAPVVTVDPPAPTRAARLGMPMMDGPVRQARADVPAATTPTVPGYIPNAGDLGFSNPAAATGGSCGPDGCPTGSYGECEGCGPAGRVWARFEWLYFTTSGQRLPPLVTTSPAGGTGALGTGTSVLFGGNKTNSDFRNGFRLNLGFWIDQAQRWGVEGEFLYLSRSRTGYTATSNGTPLLARPFTNVLTGLPDSQLVAAPGVLAGTVGVDSRTSVIGGGVNVLRNLTCSPCGRLDLVIGYRYLNLTDDLRVTEDLIALAQSNVPDGTRFQIVDRFRTENNFHGGVIGLSGERRLGAFFVGFKASVALGVNHQVVDITGSTIRTPSGGTPVTQTGGLLALPSNIGRYTRNQFAVVPDIGVRFGVQITEHCRIFAGYNFIYMNNVLRAGDQIDTRVNPNLLPPAIAGGPALPRFTPKSTDFWIHGVSAGLEFRF